MWSDVVTMPRHIDRERLHLCGVDVQDVVDHYVEKHWGESIRKTMAKYRTDDRNGKEKGMDEGNAINTPDKKHTGLAVGPKAGNAELVTEDLLRKAWARGHRYVKEPDGRMLTLMIGDHPDGATAYRLHDIATGDEVDRVRAKSLWSSTREQAEAFDWIGTTPEGERAGLDDGVPLPRGIHKKIERDLARMKMDDDERAEKHRAKMAADVVEIMLADIRRHGLARIERDDLEAAVANYLDGCDLGGMKSLDERVASMHETEHLGHADLAGMEVTLDEMVSRLPGDHSARRQLVELQQRADPLVYGVPDVDKSLADYKRRRRRTQRIEVAGRALEALIINVHMRRTDDPQTDAQKLADDALYYADALLARIDETEPKDVL